MKHNDYQLAIFDFVKNSNQNGAIIAVAGSGKTTTAIETIGYMKVGRRVRFNCFNNSIKRELEKRVQEQGMNNIEVSTYNAFGWRICLREFGRVKLDENKTVNIFRMIVNSESIY